MDNKKRLDGIHNPNYKHGLSKTTIYHIFHDMKGRCYNIKDIQYKDYGGRGITICDTWLNDPKTFVEWALTNGYKEGLTIERNNNDLGYSPENCSWETRKTQNNNRRRKRMERNKKDGLPVGVYKHGKKFIARIREDGKNKNLGTHSSIEIASNVYNHEKWRIEGKDE